MPPRRVVRVRPAMKSVEEQELPNALDVQTQEEIKYADRREAIRILSQVATYHVGQRDNRHEVVDTSRIRELFMNPPSFLGSSISENLENFIEELKRIFDVMHNRAEDAPAVSWVVFESALMGRFFPRELRESSKEGKAAMLIGDIDLAKFMIHLQPVGEDKLKDREESKDKRAKIERPVQPSASVPALENEDGHKRNSYNFRARPAYLQGSIVPRGSKAPSCARCGRTHPGKCRQGQTGCFKCGQEGHIIKECPKGRQGSGNLSSKAQSSSVVPPDRMTPRGATSST
ncbi:uncharacterized protein LOC125849713, partial [Solanum stenotomum]|uniref:uncharacterized protein LOC125849713 n=1 Tax=Solanum stenotomum TaxID=172797 RepID=UPI0020D047A8